jgi:hypothetical protein
MYVVLKPPIYVTPDISISQKTAYDTDAGALIPSGI